MLTALHFVLIAGLFFISRCIFTYIHFDSPFWSVTSGQRRPSLACAGATWTAVGGKSIPAPCANFFFALTHRIRARDWIGCKSCFPSLSKTETSFNSFSGAWSTHCATQPVKIFVVLYFLYLRYRNWRNIQCSKCFLCSFLAVTVKSSGERRLLVFRLVRQANPALHRIFGMISYDQGLIQNRRQKVVNRGALRLFGGLYVCSGGFTFVKGGLTYKSDKNSTNL